MIPQEIFQKIVLFGKIRLQMINQPLNQDVLFLIELNIHWIVFIKCKSPSQKNQSTASFIYNFSY